MKFLSKKRKTYKLLLPLKFNSHSLSTVALYRERIYRRRSSYVQNYICYTYGLYTCTNMYIPVFYGKYV